MNEKMKKTLSKVRTGCYLLPCCLIAGGAAFGGNNTSSADAVIELDAYDISKIEEALKAQENSEILENKSVVSIGKLPVKEAKSSKHGEAQSFVDGTYEGVGVGFAGHIKVKVVVENSKIVSIEVIEVEADDAPFVAKAKGVITSILQYQTLDVDTVSGATYSSKGIIAAVRNALEGVEDTSEIAPQKGKPAPTALPAFGDSEYKDGVYYGTGTGFGGEVKVKVVIKDGKITEITIESAGGEDGSYLSRAKTLIEKVLEKQSPNVDTVSGATYTSNGIISAIQNALTQAKKEDAGDKEDTTKKTEKEDNSSEKGTNSYIDGVYTGTAKGFRGNMTATVTIKKQKITKITIDSDDDEAFLKRAKTLISTIIKKQTPDGIDVVSGATYSSNGILNSVKEALKKASNSGDSESDSKTSTPTPTVTATPTATPLPAEDIKDTETGGYKDGIYTGTATGFRGETKATVTIQNKQISNIDIESKDDESFLEMAKTLITTIIQKQTPEGIDVVSGATYSSNGILNAVKDALKTAVDNQTTTLTPTFTPTATPLPTSTPVATPTPATSIIPSPTATPSPTPEEGEVVEGNFKDGAYEAKAVGFNGNVLVEVLVENGAISEITIKDYVDDDEFFWEAYNGVTTQILSKQTAEGIDVVSGATYSSNGIINAVKKALDQATE